MSTEEINQRIQKSIVNREYRKGKETRFYILTVKYDDNHYGVKLLDNHEEIESADIIGRLDAAKKAAMEMLWNKFPTATISDATMVHYKDELSNKGNRPSRIGWQKELNSVLKGLFAQAESFSLNNSNLDRILERFSEYRRVNEKEYDLERQSKLSVLNRLAEWMNLISSETEQAKKGLLDLFAGRDASNKDLVKNMERLLTSQYQQVRNFKVLLEELSIGEFYELFTELIDNGLTLEVRKHFNTHYEKLLTSGKLINPNRGSLLITVQLLALLLSAHDPNNYILYQPNEFSRFLETFDITFPNDVLERYELCLIAARYVLQYSSENGYLVYDFIDICNLVMMFDSSSLGGNSDNMNKTVAKNLILYGPPGTGKTYNVINHALEVLNPDVELDLLTNPARRDEAVQLYNRYIESNQVVFCTFHQSYSYEDFVEGIRFVKESEGYEVRDGVFKRICNAARAVVTKKKHTYDFDLSTINFHKISLGNSKDANDDIYDYCVQNNKIALGWGNQVDYGQCSDKITIRERYFGLANDERKFGADAVHRFKHGIDIDDIVIVSNGNYKARAIGKVTGEYEYDEAGVIDYHHFRNVEWLWVSKDDADIVPVERILLDKNFQQQAIYMLAKEDLNIESLRELITGRNEQGTGESQFVIVIDEINRGNISKIFGELITLIEPDKRLGQKNEISVTLPYSGYKFNVPSNVHILGTMNTSDRSIALLDTALRRL
ncbi:AAA family ATPase [Paenibacillus sp. MZ04-78.2]|uniref:AAA family ATPase n=1 Tax=Paenibacillus sp. MZ04-78.2 TaxID=2962034 RepID=UPI0020B77832|nr:AAA family ATPase [Paenibacillus sp. MZ04-78.2]MCP3776679.1 AAA family ATPase [Paenibacillus sp. MZ04-78.2]